MTELPALSDLWLLSGLLVPLTAYIYYRLKTKPETNNVYNSQMKHIGDGIWISNKCTKEIPTRVPYQEDVVKTEWEIFQEGVKKDGGNRQMVGRRKGDGCEWFTYKEIHKRVKKFGSGLVALDIAKPGNDTMIGIQMKNRIEWNIVLNAGFMYSMVNVPLYPTMGKKGLEFIIGQVELKVIVCEDSKSAKGILDLDAETTASVKHIIVVEEITEELRNLVKDRDIKIHNFEVIENLGDEYPTNQLVPKEENLSTILYTSGSTGDPKGVMLTHRAMTACVVSYADGLKDELIKSDRDDIYFSYLPLSHGMERSIQACIMLQGKRIGYFGGNIKLFLEDCQAIKPNALPMVPRIMNRFYSTVMNTVSKMPVWKRIIFHLAINNWLPGPMKSLCLAKVRNILGGDIKLIISGSAPVEPRVINAIKSMLECEVLEGYGLTETCSGITAMLPGDPEYGHCGSVFPCGMLKIADVPDMDYYSKERKGEVLLKGESIMVGYYKNEEKTKETIDEDGWLHTGDIGYITDRGTLRIIDRVKSIFKLSQGEYIAPEKIENIYSKFNYIGHIVVYGNSYKSQLVGLVFVDENSLRERFTGNNDLTLTQLCDKTDVITTVLAELTQVGKDNDLASFEQVKAIKLMPRTLTIEEGLLTPTLKLKRPKVIKQFKEVFEQLYSQIGARNDLM